MTDATAAAATAAFPSIEVMVEGALAQLPALKPATLRALSAPLASRYQRARAATAEAIARADHARQVGRAAFRETTVTQTDPRTLSRRACDLQDEFAALVAAIETTVRPTSDGWARLDPRIPLDENPVFAPALDAAQGRARERTSTGASLSQYVEGVMKTVNAQLFVKDQTGIVWTIDPHAQHFPSAYRGKPESTQILLRRSRKGWEARPIRDRCTPSRLRISVENRAALAEALAARFLSGSKWVL